MWRTIGNTVGLPQLQGQTVAEPSVTSQGKNLRSFVSAEGIAELYRGLGKFIRSVLCAFSHTVLKFCYLNSVSEQATQF